LEDFEEEPQREEQVKSVDDSEMSVESEASDPTPINLYEERFREQAPEA